MATDMKEIKDKSFIKTLTIIIISFISLPILVMGMMYFSNEGFKDNANNILSALPGTVGNYFQEIPTKDERQDLKKSIAKHYVNLDEDRIVDKLLIVKGEDSELYNELIVLMSRENSNKMKIVKDNLKALQFKNDPLNRIMVEIDKDGEEKTNNLTKYFTSLNTSNAIAEIERIYGNNEMSTEELATVFRKLKPEQASLYLFNLDTDISTQIEYKLPKESLRAIEKKKQELEKKREDLFHLSDVYKNTSLEQAIDELGNTKLYNVQDLAFILKELPVTRSSKILSNVDNNDFMLTLFTQIDELERLEKIVPGTSANITKGITVYKEYDEKINELVLIYQKTPVEDLAKILNTMLKRNEVYKKHSLNDLEEITFNEEQLVLDVVQRLKNNVVVELLKKMEERDAIAFSKKLMK